MTLRLWVDARRHEQPHELRSLLPGEIMRRAQGMAIVMLAMIGFITGIAVAGGLLEYGRHDPISVTWYLFALVGVQLLIALAALVTWLLRNTSIVRGAMADVSLIGELLKPLYRRVLGWVQDARLDQLPADARERFRAERGRMQARFALNGQAYVFAALVPAQWFGIAFNLGAILITFSLITFKDLGFGWETTHAVSTEGASQVVRSISLPWGWFTGEGVGFPSLGDIEVTRIDRQTTVRATAEQLHSWRWFLILAVVFYGLLPRIGLLALSLVGSSRSLDRLPVLKGRSVYGRMVTPNVAAAGREVEQGTPPSAAAGARLEQTATPDKLYSIAADESVFLLHVDLSASLAEVDHAHLAELFQRATGWRIGQKATFGAGPSSDKKALDLVQGCDWREPPARILLLMDGSDPPIVETMRFLKDLRAAIGADAQIVVNLVGSPKRGDAIRPIRSLDLIDWQRKIDAIGDPYLELKPLVGMEADKQ